MIVHYVMMLLYNEHIYILQITQYLFLKSHKPFLNRSFVTKIECITSLFVKIMPKTPVLKPKIQ